MTITRIHSDSGVTSYAPPLSECDFDLAVREIQAEVPNGTGSEVTVEDRVYETSGPDIDHTARVSVLEVADDALDDGVVFDVNADHVSISTDGNVTIADTETAARDVQVLARTPCLTKAKSVFLGREAAGTAFDRFKTGSAARSAEAAVDDNLTGDDDQRIYTSRDHETPAFTRNASLWLPSVDLTCISPSNDQTSYPNTRAGTAITKDAVVFANHYPLLTGTIIRFVDDSNNVIERRIGATERVTSNGLTDIEVGLLTDPTTETRSELPAAITPCEIIPADPSDYLPALTNWNALVPAVFSNYRGTLGVGEIKASLPDHRGHLYMPEDETRLAMWDYPRSGDSGQVAFLVIDGKLVYLFHFATVATQTIDGETVTVSALGPWISRHKAAVNTSLSNIGSSYTVTEADLSGFEDFSA